MDGAKRFGRYTVVGTLGKGAMGQVYAAIDDVLGRPVAVKTLRNGVEGMGAQVLDERFRLEARAIAALNHPSVVQVYDIDLSADPPYLVMERMAGRSLRDQLEEGPMQPNEVRALGIQISRALAAAHDAGIVHRDVKPANILAAGPGLWKLADFGVAHVPDSSLTVTGQFIGSPAYAAPEALFQGKTTPAGDVFGLGASLYFCAAGRWPRTDSSTAELLSPTPSLRSLAPHLPEDLIRTIDLSIHVDPARRPSASELAAALASATPPAMDRALETSAVADATVASKRAARSPAPVETAFVPDATHDSRGGEGRQADLPVATAFVPEFTYGGDAVAPSPAPPSSARWRRWGVGAIALGIVAALVASASQRSSNASDERRSPWSLPLAPAADPAGTEPPVPPETLRVATPPIRDRRAVDDWGKIIDDLYDQRFDKARRRLSEWERRWGQWPEARSLREQLDALPYVDPRRRSDD